MTRRYHGRAIGSLPVCKGMERLPNAIDWSETDHEWVIDLEGDRKLVLSKTEFVKVGFIDYRESVMFGLPGGWHFAPGTDRYEQFRESWDDSSLATGGDGIDYQRSERRGGRA